MTRELAGHLGILWDTLDQLADVAGRQARHFAEDYLTTLSKLLDGSAAADGPLLLGLAERRLTHLSEGVAQSVDVLSTRSEIACQALRRLSSRQRTNAGRP